MSEYPDTLYHYTSLETLALILTNKTICFNTLLNVDDTEEAETSDLGKFGKYVYVSCWTDEADESIPMWQMYSPNMHGVRIQLPKFPFKEHFYKSGEFHFTCDTSTYLNLQKIYDDDKTSIVPELPKLIPVTYTDDESLIRPQARFGDSANECENVINRKTYGNQNKSVRYDLSNLGKFKNTAWSFQKEWRYWISMSPFSMKELESATTETHIEFMKRLEDTERRPPYERFFLELSDTALSQMKVVFGPRMTPAEKILAKHLLNGCGMNIQWSDSSLNIQ